VSLSVAEEEEEKEQEDDVPCRTLLDIPVVVDAIPCKRRVGLRSVFKK
jgi:hypothetical protein